VPPRAARRHGRRRVHGPARRALESRQLAKELLAPPFGVVQGVGRRNRALHSRRRARLRDALAPTTPGVYVLWQSGQLQYAMQDALKIIGETTAFSRERLAANLVEHPGDFVAFVKVSLGAAGAPNKTSYADRAPTPPGHLEAGVVKSAARLCGGEAGALGWREEEEGLRPNCAVGFTV